MSDNKVISKFSRYQKFVISILALTQFTVVLDFMVMSPLGDMLMKSMSLSTVQFGVAVFSYAFSAGISGLLTAGFADSFDRKKLLLFFYVGFILGTLFCGLADTYPLLIAARIITGLFGGVIGSISMAIVSDLFPLEKRGRVMGFLQMGFGASQVLGIPISLYIANHWGWQSPFLMIVGLAFIIFLVIVLKLKPITAHLDKARETNAFKRNVSFRSPSRSSSFCEKRPSLSEEEGGGIEEKMKLQIIIISFRNIQRDKILQEDVFISPKIEKVCELAIKLVLAKLCLVFEWMLGTTGSSKTKVESFFPPN